MRKSGMTPELKPCPFCGFEAKLKQDIRYPKPAREPRKAFEVVCQNPECIIGFVDEKYFMLKREAVETWNRRYDDGKNKI